MSATTILYPTVPGVQDRLSIIGLALRVDDQPPTANRNAVLRTTCLVNRYLLKGYDPVVLATSDMVIEAANDIATRFICQGRGNPVPSPLEQTFSETIAWLEQVRKGLQDLDVPRRRQSCPVMSNMRVRLAPEPHSRREVARSTTTGGTPTDYRQHADHYQYEAWYGGW